MGGGKERDGEGGRERKNSNWKTLFYKDCSLGSVTVLAKLLISKYLITGIIYIHISMSE